MRILSPIIFLFAVNQRLTRIPMSGRESEESEFKRRKNERDAYTYIPREKENEIRKTKRGISWSDNLKPARNT